MGVIGFLCGSYKDVYPFLLACFTGSSVCVIIAGSMMNSGASIHGRVDKDCFFFPLGTTLPVQQQPLPFQDPLNTRLLLLFSATHQALLPSPTVAQLPAPARHCPGWFKPLYWSWLVLTGWVIYTGPAHPYAKPWASHLPSITEGGQRFEPVPGRGGPNRNIYKPPG